jgi:hypothetical protein
MAFKFVRGLGIGAALGLFALLSVALFVGPSVGVLGASLTWSALLLLAVVSTAVGVGRLDELHGAHRALLLADYDPKLAQRVRSAAELAAAPNGSPELLTELLTSITNELSHLPISTLVPRPKHWGRTLLGSLAFAGLSAALLASREDVATGLYAMTHPATGLSERAPKGLWISRLDVVVSQPQKLGGETRVLRDPALIEVPEGSVVELSVRARVPIDRAMLKLGERALPFVAVDGGLQRLTLTAETGGPLSLLARVDDAWVEDAKARRMDVILDAAPTVELEAPLADVSVAADEPVVFSYRTKDDHGLSGIDLVIELGQGRQRRVRLFGFPENAVPRTQDGSTDVVPAAFGARTGQTLAVWIEARDRDTFGGANVGRSPVRTITVGEVHEGHGVPVELLARARDAAVDTLAERLETELPVRQGEAQERAEALAKSTRGFSRALTSLAKSYADSGGESATQSTLRDMLRRLSRLLRDERVASEGRDMREPKRADEAVLRELEDDVLWLSDLLGREKLSNAGKAIERLASTRGRIQKLIEELKKAWDPARKAELLAEIARARAELSLLSQRLAEAERDVPGDFVNLEALRAAAEQNPLDEIEQAIKRGDLAAAEKALARLDQDMQNFQKGVSEGGEAFASARFGPRNEAIEKARTGLSELTKRQKQLSSETDRIAEKAHARSEEEPDFRSQNQRLSERAEALERRVQRLGTSDRFHATESESQAGAAQRMRDARDALRQQNPREAASMAERASEDLQALAGELMMDARMFPGPDGSELERARNAQKLAEEAADLAQEIARNTAGDRSELTPEESAALQQKAPPQRGLSESAEGLAQDLRSDGPPGLSDGLGRTARSMKKAASALERGDVREAEAHQRDAVERLAELNEQMERQSKAGKPRSSEMEGSSSPGDQEERVTIPESGQDVRRKDLRRRVLDARRAEPPDSFARAVERYYQEILR